MPLKQMTVDELMTLAGCGGGFRHSGKHLTPDQMMDIAGRAKSGGARVTFTEIRNVPHDELYKIATRGGGNVSFEDD